MFGARLCAGGVDAICKHASDALGGPCDRLRDWVLRQAALHVDETGWRTGRRFACAVDDEDPKRVAV